jgi:hypothetical protein
VRQAGVPPDVELTAVPRAPEPRSDIGIEVELASAPGRPRHWLVSLGDSLTQGFKNGAICDTHLAYPAMLAHELGWEREFRQPMHARRAGVLLDLEQLLRELEGEFGATLGTDENIATAEATRRLIEAHEGFWERGPGVWIPPQRSLQRSNRAYTCQGREIGQVI